MSEVQGQPLDPELLPYLDWPTVVIDNEVWCAKDGCVRGACAKSGTQAWVCAQSGLTIRALLEGVRKHAAEPAGLDPALVVYLDWPVWMREDGVTCERADCRHEDCRNPGWGPVQVSESGHTTLRAILEGLKQHAEGKP